MDLAARASVKMEEAAPAGMRWWPVAGGGVPRGWWQVAAAEAMSMTEAVAAMAEATVRPAKGGQALVRDIVGDPLRTRVRAMRASFGWLTPRVA